MRRILAVALPLSLAACGAAEHQAQPASANPFAGIQAATSVLVPTAGSTARGVVRFTEADGKLLLVADVEGLQPGQLHAIHVHELGDCSAADGTSAGSHYNPEGHPHGLPAQEHRHAGDLGNLQADDAGKAHYEFTVVNATLTGHNPIFGRAVIVHARPDDGGQPVGNAGARIACGVIGVAKK